ncbi:MAG: hypothetical protein HYZ09_02670 [Candidatus Kerfeldbacteria bacterium]|nr:hypothetical protein [Candidatus Kerfeldbacteria bacterium]
MDIPAREIKVVRLVDGQRVRLRLGSVSYQDQTFVRLGVRLIVGVFCDPNDSPLPKLFLWHERNGVYECHGIAAFKERPDGSVVWDVNAWIDDVRVGAEFRTAENPHFPWIDSANFVRLLSRT